MSIILLQVLIIVGIMTVIGIVIGFIANFVWKENRPIGVKGDFIAAILSCIVFGLGEWFLLPALGFNQTVKLLGTFIEAPIIAFAVLWLIRYIDKRK